MAQSKSAPEPIAGAIRGSDFRIDVSGKTAAQKEQENQMSAITAKDRRFVVIRIHDRAGQQVPPEEAKTIALAHPAIPPDSIIIEGPQRNVPLQSVDVVVAHPSFDQVPAGQESPIVNVE